VVRLRISRISFAAKHIDDVHEQIIICRQLFAGHVVGFQPMRRTKNLHPMIMLIMRLYSLVKELVVK